MTRPKIASKKFPPNTHDIYSTISVKVDEFRVRKLPVQDEPANFWPKNTYLQLYVFFQKKTYYLDSQVKGQSSLPTILIFHDAGLSSNTWLKLGLLHELNVNGYRAVVIDLPGHGGSDKTEIIQDQDEKG